MPNYVNMFKLEGHQEGGYFRRFYKSPDKVIPLSKHYDNHNSQNTNEKKRIERHAGSATYFLLEKHSFSAWHRLKPIEIWHYYDGGSPIDIHVIDSDGLLKTYTLGNPSITENASFQVVIEGGLWFAAELRDTSSFGFMGCSVSPAFKYDDFELAEKYRDVLVIQYPELIDIIDKFIKPTLRKSYDQDHNHIVPYSKNRLSAKDYMRKFNLKKHQIGGYFALHYQSIDRVHPLDNRYKKEINESVIRPTVSAIYFLLEKNDFAAWHQLKSDAVWHYYDGSSPIDIHLIDQKGNLKTRTLGNPSLTKNASFQVVVKAGHWLAAEVRDKTAFGLTGCTISPGLEYDDCMLANREYLASQYPKHISIINRLSCATS